MVKELKAGVLVPRGSTAALQEGKFVGIAIRNYSWLWEGAVPVQ